MSKAWLSDLEERVHHASDRLRELRDENERLDARCQELEARVEELEATPGDGEAGVDGEAAAWRIEREEIRGRVETLVDHLANLLDEEADSAASR